MESDYAHARLSVAVIVHDETADRIALFHCLPGGSPMGGRYTVPGGKVDAGESLVDAAVREVKEEAGLILDPGALSLVHLAQVYNHPDVPQFVLAVYVATRWSGELTNREPDKVGSVAWADPDRLPQPMMAATAAAVGGWRAGRCGTSVHEWDGTR